MKGLKSIFTIAIGALLLCSSCDDFLNRKPLDMISDNDVWSNESSITAYMAGMYDAMFVEPHGWLLNWGTIGHYTDESMRSYSWGHPYTPTYANDFLSTDDIWNSTYRSIRTVNDFFEKLPNSPIADDLKERYLAEAHFIRAFYYFTLAKRFGGVPVIETVQQYDGSNIEELKVPRSTEEETWNFVAKECDLAYEKLPESYPAANQFRVTRYAAAALKARAMLYAGTISKYGSVQLNGLVGIDPAKANGFFEKSLNASDLIIKSGRFSLYKKSEDKAANYQNLFLDKTLHEEAIFVKAFAVPDKGHNFDYAMAAPSFKIDWGTNTSPTLELVEAYEYTDGTPGTLVTEDSSGKPIFYDKADDIFKNKDPRFFASVLYPNSPWQGNVLEVRRGIIDSKGVKIEATAFADKFPEDPTLTTSGKDGLVMQGDCSRTGFYVKKFMDPANRIEENRSESNFMVFRYAETLLNYAEAAAELGRTNDALPKLNEVRTRAGIKEKSTATVAEVRRERQVELAFENLRIWDLIRWRTATTVMNNTQFSALIPWMDYKTRKYTFEKGPNTLQLPKTFLDKNYYQPIPEVEKNDRLVQNPGF